MTLKKKVLFALIILLLLCILIWVGSIVKCEILTLRHAEEFSQVWQTEGALAPPDYWKVLKYSDDQASVYFVGTDRQGGTVLFFQKIDGAWVVESWGPYWSRSGTADDLIWPYIR